MAKNTAKKRTEKQLQALAKWNEWQRSAEYQAAKRKFRKDGCPIPDVRPVPPPDKRPVPDSEDGMTREERAFWKGTPDKTPDKRPVPPPDKAELLRQLECLERGRAGEFMLTDAQRDRAARIRKRLEEL